MKKATLLIIVAALAFGLPAVSSAAEKKMKAADAPKSEEAKPKEAKPAGDKPMPMHFKVDAIDGTTFTHTNKDGTVVKCVATDKTEVANDGKPAKLKDIKVGDTINGLRLKKSPTEYEIVKITGFGVAPVKPKKADAEKAEKKAE
jgi:hypothetical protein